MRGQTLRLRTQLTRMKTDEYKNGGGETKLSTCVVFVKREKSNECMPVARCSKRLNAAHLQD